MTATQTQPVAAKQEFVRPFPALTAAQRYHFDAYGYVIIPGVFTRDECGRMYDALTRLRADLRRADPADPMRARVRGARFILNKPHHVYVVSMYEYDDALLEYACHPRIVGMCEEVMGCEARITEFDAHVNSRDPDDDLSKPPTYGFHNGVDIPFGSHTAHNGLYHCNFVKALTNLTDIGPDDGGTVVIAGSHKVLDYQGAIAAAAENPALIHRVIAPAGSTLLFGETLIHATGRITSDKERAIIIVGYGPPMYPMWDATELSPQFLARIPECLKTLFHGRANWNRKPRYRKLSDPTDTRPIQPVKWPAL